MRLYVFQSNDGKRFFITTAQNLDHARDQVQVKHPYDKLRFTDDRLYNDVVCLVVAQAPGCTPPQPLVKEG